jgi:exopolyphosphatase/pppGpp-phosphohydrolase
MRIHRQREHLAVANEPVCPKFYAIQRWVMCHLRTVEHEHQVAAIASNLFDQSRTLHTLNLADRRLLRLGAMVHDVGRCVNKAEHPRKGAEMILADTTLPLSSAERRALAYLTLYHRGPVPRVRRDAILHRTDDAGRLLGLLAILRSADALDSRSLEPARLMFALLDGSRTNGPRVLRITCYLENECEKARKVYRRRRKFRLLEELLDVRVEVEIEIDHVERLRLVA